MIKIKILTVGKTKETWLEDALSEYLKRMQGVVDFEFLIAKDDRQLLTWVSKETQFICLDSAGKTLTSEAFSQFLHQRWLEWGSRLTFVIGGPEGLPKSLREHQPSLSLSSMTFTHQVVRLILIEQIYRALEIAKGSPYHK